MDASARTPTVRAPQGDIVTAPWLGGPVDCTACVHGPERVRLGCEPGHSCMQDAYARRIDRFFHQHPELALQHLQHPYFEVRAIAARHVDLFHLSALRNDPDETVRMQVALRLPPRQLAALCDDPHREVRIRVAHRIADEHLSRLLHDPDYQVRAVVARRLPQALLPMLAADPDEQVRRVVAERLEMPALWRLAHDTSPAVRRLVAERAPVPLLTALATDADWGVRWQVASRADVATQQALLRSLARDADPEVRALAGERLASHLPAVLEVFGHG
jgi:hypothetical protein